MSERKPKKDEHDHEDVYDAQIAPLMTQIIDVCKAHDLPMSATFEYATRKYCSTHLPFDTGSLLMRVMGWAQRCDIGERGWNVDAFLMAFVAYAKEHGHTSMYLSLLGVKPTEKPREAP